MFKKIKGKNECFHQKIENVKNNIKSNRSFITEKPQDKSPNGQV